MVGFTLSKLSIEDGTRRVLKAGKLRLRSPLRASKGACLTRVAYKRRLEDHQILSLLLHRMLSIGGSTTVNFMVYGVCLALIFPVVDSCSISTFQAKVSVKVYRCMYLILGVYAVFLNSYRRRSP